MALDNDLDQALICSLAQCSELLKSLVVEGFLVVDFGFLRSFLSILWGLDILLACTYCIFLLEKIHSGLLS